MNPYSFDACLEFVFWVEGIYSDLKMDKGGATKYGISQAAYPHIDIPNLDKETAQFLYKRDYWTPVGAELLPGPLAAYLFDAAVNCGTFQSSKWLQRALNSLGHNLSVDGVIGKKTLAVVEIHSVPVIVELVGIFRRRHYYQITKKAPSQRVFGEGWMERANKIGLFCAGMSLGDIKKFYKG
jgi:lysozyme family protein